MKPVSFISFKKAVDGKCGVRGPIDSVLSVLESGTDYDMRVSLYGKMAASLGQLVRNGTLGGLTLELADGAGKGGFPV